MFIEQGEPHVMKINKILKAVAAIGAATLVLTSCTGGETTPSQTPSNIETPEVQPSESESPVDSETPGDPVEGESSDAQEISQLFETLYNNIEFSEDYYDFEVLLTDFTDEDGNPSLESESSWGELSQEKQDALLKKYVEDNPLAEYLYVGDLTDYEKVTIAATLTFAFSLYSSDPGVDITVYVPAESVVFNSDSNAFIDEAKIYSTVNGEEVYTGLGADGEVISSSILVAVKDSGEWLLDLPSISTKFVEVVDEN